MNIYEQYGLKEVANVTFYDIETQKPVLFLDSLKVSTIEQTAENVEARGGWGNPALISWDYNKDVNLTLEDALFSPMSLKVMMGAGYKVAEAAATQLIDVNEEVTITTAGTATLEFPASTNATRVPSYFDAETGEFVETGFTITGNTVTVSNTELKTKSIRFFYQTEADDTNVHAMTITIDAGTFGGTYKIVGDTVVRSRETGKDEAFQFIINKAKINSEISFTMEAEGDPATFNMPIRVLKDSEGNMFKMIKYSLPHSN